MSTTSPAPTGRFPLSAAVATARLAGRAARLGGRGGTSLPGKVLTRLRPDAIARMSDRLDEGSVVLSATNGKTTTAALVASILELHGTTLVHNRQGANMAGGIAASLLGSWRHGRPTGALGLFEVDEFWLDGLVRSLRPRVVLLANLFRDQLDRYGELEAIADRWHEIVADDAARTAAGDGPGFRLVLGSDDPAVADLGLDRDDVLYFGVQDVSVAREVADHASDATTCRVCGASYVYTATFVGHLGHYRCPACGHRRPDPQVTAERVVLDATRGSSFDLVLPDTTVPVRLHLPGLYNVYNALGAAALTHALGVPAATIAEGLGTTAAAFGRAETVTVGDRELQLLLVKNPAGANEVARTLALAEGELDLLAVLNDRIADGRDVSWIWDADLEAIAGRVRHVTCAGSRAEEMAVRWKYAGVASSRIAVVKDGVGAALDHALAAAPEDHAVPIHAIPTYTAMLELREELVRRGAAKGSFA
ncbi:MurT ligase domain-containing protein [Patulibacter sp.]|uniref:MurT ligase domain-containing protein n=1 Tax=Patulibacter sp. TaxID=1912859 RepID=UPI00271B1EA3|nr:MurT ligase domain-containing protein [Patulibacter sp.]MDO9407037.1 MurT ligase domain-containing protein [Patulibacter sp.]